MGDLLVKRGDTLPWPHTTLSDQDGNPVDLTGASVRFVMRSLAAPSGSAPAVDTPAVVAVDQAAQRGQTWHPWAAGQTDRPDAYGVEWKVTFPDGTVQTFPTQGFDTVTVVDDLEQHLAAMQLKAAMPPARVSRPQPWASPADLRARQGMDTLTDDQAGAVLAQASELLYLLSGSRWPGLIPDVVRPTSGRGVCDPRSSAHGNELVGWALPVPYDGPGPAGGIQACSCGGLAYSCCPRLQQVRLPGPVVSIAGVRVDGTTVDAARYRVDEQRWLVRVPDPDGSNPGWPVCQRLDLPATEPGTFEVAYVRGAEPPAAGTQVCVTLAAELAKAAGYASGPCRLPERITSITRQGISMAVIDPMTVIKEGGTGLADVDLWLAAVNPNRLRRSASIASPDIPPLVRRAG